MDNRKYFRLKDHVGLRVQFLNQIPKTDPYSEEFHIPESLSILNQIHSLDADLLEIQRSIPSQHQAIAACIASLNKKVDLVTQLNPNPIEGLKKAKVSLSEVGLAFSCATDIPVRQWCHLLIKLLPSNTHLACFAEVMHSSSEPLQKGQTDVQYKIGLEFKKLSTQSQKLIAKHIRQKQSIQLRAEKTPS
jgi:hypothetical protein